MWRKHGDPLFSDAKKVQGLPPGTHMRRGYRMIGPVSEHRVANPADATVEKSDAHAKSLTKAHGFRDGTKRNRRDWEHRKVAGAKSGQIVHHIDGDPLNNRRENLHVFDNPKDHGLAHRSLEMIAYQMLRDGLVRFDRSSGLYVTGECDP